MGEARSIEARLSSDVVARFANLTGDRSHLHLADAFARRTAYRQPIAHGMLAFAFAPLLPGLRQEGSRCILTGLTGRFLAPAFVGDVVRLTAGERRSGSVDGSLVFPLRVAQSTTGATITEGEISVRYLPDSEAAGSPGEEAGSGGSGMVTEELTVRDLTLAEIDKGMTSGFGFRISEGVIAAYLDLLTAGAGDRAAGQLSAAVAGFHVPNLLAVLAFSTSVGVLLPGASATFLEFSSQLHADIALHVDYTMAGTVVHRSLGTRIVTQELTVRTQGQDDVIALSGRAAALVADPPRRMPTIEQLKENAIDPGLDGKVAIVTGSSRGIGETIAKLLSLHGTKVAVTYYRGAEDAARIVQEISAAGGVGRAIAVDVTQPDQVENLVQETVRQFGRIDILVNNAARDFRPVKFSELTWAEIQEDIEVIVKGAFLCCKHVVPIMSAQGSGKIINISTVAVDDPPPDQLKYVMAKAALVGLTRSLSRDLARENIHVNTVVPSFVETDLVAHVPEGFRKRIAEATPLGRNASPIEVAQAVLFLASSFSSFTTGQKVMVTGGGAPYT